MDAEARSLRTGVTVLVVVSLARALWGGGGSPSGASEPPSTLPELSAAVDSAAASAERRSRPLADGELIDPNVAGESDLDRLPGIGPSAAVSIVRARQAGAVFETIDDLTLVRGIGPATVERIRPHVRIAPVRRRRPRVPSRTTLMDLNRADSSALLNLPGVGPTIAGRILARRRGQRFNAVDELVEVPGIGPATFRRLEPLVTVTGR